MKTMIKNNNFNNLSKIAFLMNIPLVLLYELRGELPFALLWQHSETVSLWQGVIIYYTILCILVTILDVVYFALQKVNKFQKV